MKKCRMEKDGGVGGEGWVGYLEPKVISKYSKMLGKED